MTADLKAMAEEYQLILNLLGPEPTDEAIAFVNAWNADHDWREYRRAWWIVRYMEVPGDDSR